MLINRRPGYTLDFETRSAAPFGRGSKATTQYEYSVHPSTSVLCLAWTRDGDEVDLWHTAFEDMTPLLADTKKGRAEEPHHIKATPEPLELFDAILEGSCLFEAHNASFERAIWENVCVARMGWPAIDPRRWRCSAVKAAVFALPRDLERACAVMRVAQQKDGRGKLLIQQYCKPAAKNSKVVKRELGVFLQTYQGLTDLFEYCRQDVRAEHAFSSQLREMGPDEMETYLMDQDINFDGISIDHAMLDGAEAILTVARGVANKEICAITGGDVERITQRQKFVDWLNDNWFEAEPGMPITSIAKEKVEEYLKRDSYLDSKGEQCWDMDLWDENVLRGLQIWQRNAKSSVGKYGKIRATMNKDDHRVRNNLVFHGASTGRWTGKGMQIHNFPRGYPLKKIDETCEMITQGDYETMALYYSSDEIMEILADSLRGIIVPDEGYVFRGADYSAIEARGTFWAAGHDVGLDVFRRYDAGEGPDVYCWQAEKMYGRPISPKDPERQRGKVVVLGCGYQMGWRKLITYAEDYKLDLTTDQSKDLVNDYRSTNWPVTGLWKDMEDAAILATLRKGQGAAVECGPFRFKRIGRFLHMRLPSGRLLAYLSPAVKPRLVQMREDPDNPLVVTSEFVKDSLSYEGMDTYTNKWKRCHTYGGKLVENAVQGLCRDIMASAMLRLRGTCYQLKFTVHDEIVAQTRVGEGSGEEFAGIMAQAPYWAGDMPIEADSWTGARFHKS